LNNLNFLRVGLGLLVNKRVAEQVSDLGHQQGQIFLQPHHEVLHDRLALVLRHEVLAHLCDDLQCVQF
jgi:hypothetical protein